MRNERCNARHLCVGEGERNKQNVCLASSTATQNRKKLLAELLSHYTHFNFPFTAGFLVGLDVLLASGTFSFAAKLLLLLLGVKTGVTMDVVGVAGKFAGGGLAPFGIFGLGTRFPRGGGDASAITGSTFERRE